LNVFSGEGFSEWLKKYEIVGEKQNILKRKRKPLFGKIYGENEGLIRTMPRE